MVDQTTTTSTATARTTSPPTAAKAVVLYGYATSPFVNKVAHFLQYKKISFQHVAVNPIFPFLQLHRFPGQRKVPVLTIDDDWKADSTSIGIWLDEQFPAHPKLLGDTPQETQAILALDEWVTNELIAELFRTVVDWNGRPWEAIEKGWRLASILQDFTPIPFFIRWFWPIILRFVPFIRRFAYPTTPLLLTLVPSVLDTNESLEDMRARQRQEFVHHLGGGPYLGGRKTVSLADLSAFSVLTTFRFWGLHFGPAPFLQHKDTVAWLHRVQAQLPNNPTVMPDRFMEWSLPCVSKLTQDAGDSS
ncbi:Inherit from COG: glutathione Stransferase [Seminavis robusta]|uniref:Inherit from COG: glutathione Stransferase n=1 Tax=Seminavis robusta TaxID=568900 RepID=A0A9N8H9E6_9STRA|nr:Inherit from COG: glutathione Stransferase [Seminavis robusta]|eukprot:Sro203_g085610.1 Inherit from COG: glutathione Stransferase (304) ;mRNA; f:58245-59156